MKSWLSSPLAINYLLHLLKNDAPFPKKYEQIYSNIRNKGYKFSNKFFFQPSQNEFKVIKTANIEVEEIEIQNSVNIVEHVMKWVNRYGNFKKDDIESMVLNKTSLLCNISHFKGTWNRNYPSPIMNVHYSFSYTEDIKYKARLLELPMRDDEFKLVVVVPNETSSLPDLFNKLAQEGLDAAVSCVQPLFTFSTVLEAPYIEFSSRGLVSLNENKCDNYDAVQLGNVAINEKGTTITVLTCLRFKCIQPMETVNEKSSLTELPFYFAVLYNNTAIFTGRYVKR